MLELMSSFAMSLLAVSAISIIGYVFVLITFRRVVPTNEVHIIQTSKGTKNYGQVEEGAGNVYYEWPFFLPIIGVKKTIFPVSIFDLKLDDYEAFDVDRLPFILDVLTFFRIDKPEITAKRAESFPHLLEQLSGIVQSAVRSVMATHPLEEIMKDRSKFGGGPQKDSQASNGETFFDQMNEQLGEWGVLVVKEVEIMDIRDSEESEVIANIMEKKKSEVAAQSRVAVANNERNAKIAEIQARKDAELEDQESRKAVEMRKIEVEQTTALSRESQAQKVKEQQKVTKEREMDVIKTQTLRQAEIDKEKALVRAEQDKQTAIIQAEQSKQEIVIAAEADLEQKTKEAEGVKAYAIHESEATKLKGQADAEARRAKGLAEAESQAALLKAQAEGAAAMQMAPVDAQIKLAKEIGAQKDYQEYLIRDKKVQADKEIGVAQAGAMAEADIKVIANAGNAADGITSAKEILSSKGGTAVGAFLEGLANTDQGKALLSLLPKKEE